MSTFTVWILAFLIVIAFQRFWIEGGEHVQASRGTVKAAWTGYLMIAFHVLIYTLTTLELLLRSHLKTSNFSLISSVGLSMFAIGFFLRRWAISTLGYYWSLQIEIRPNQPLIRKGPYRFVRHPNYLALFLEVLGLPLVANAYLTFISSLLFYCPLIFTRLVYEERVLLKTFPQTYRQYQRECGVLLPTQLFFKRTNI